MAGINRDDKFAATDRLDVDDLEHAFEMCLIGIFDDVGPAQPIPARPAKILALPSLEHGLALPLAEHHASRLEELQTIILRRVMRRGELDAADRSAVGNQHSHGRRGRRLGHKRIAPGRRDPGDDGREKHRRRRPCIVADHDRTQFTLACVSRDKLDHDHRIEPVSHQAAEPGDTRDPGPSHG